MRLAYLVSHPIQYQAPLLRRIAREPGIDLTVLYGSDFSVRGYQDKGFGVEVAWDTPLLEGYKSDTLKSWRDTGTVSFSSPISRGIYRRLRELQPDALWLHGYASINSLLGILAANALGIPVLLRAESWLGDRRRSPLKLAAKSLLLRALSHSIAAVLPIGSRNAEYWRHYMPGIPQFPMPYAVDNDRFAALATAADTAALRAKLHLDPARPVILFASKLQPRKHAGHLLTAFHSLLDSRVAHSSRALGAMSAEPPPPYLLLVGDGEERARLQQQATDLGIADHLRFAGFRNQSELPGLFKLASVFVLPSQHEPWGLIVNEAMACGCPVIVSSDVGCHPDLITDSVEGFIYPCGDIPALTSALRRIISVPGVSAKMGEAARRRIATWSFEQDIAGLRAALAHTTGKLRA